MPVVDDVHCFSTCLRSRHTDPWRLRRALAGDLDNIVLRALCKEPQRRFTSAAAFSEDLKRYLKDLPVHSRPDTWSYRATKLVRRHPLRVGAMALIVLLIVGGTIVTAIQNSKIKRQSEIILEERDRARESLKLFVDVLDASDPRKARGEAHDLRDVLDSAAGRLRNDRQTKPEVRAALLGAIGVVYMSLDLRDKARASLAEALALRRINLDPDDPELADSLHDLANLKQKEKNLEVAATLMQEGIDIQHIAYPNGHRDLARGLTNYATVLRKLKRFEEAERVARESLAMKVKVLGKNDGDVSTSLNLLGNLMKDKKDYAEAEALYQQAITVRRAVAGGDDPILAVYLNNLGVLFVDRMDRAKEALPLQQESLEIRRKVYQGMDHSSLVTILNNLTITLTATDDYDRANEFADETLAVAQRVYETAPLRILRYRKNKAMVLAAIGDLIACERMIAEVLAREKDAKRLAEAKSIQGACLAGLGRRDEAERLLREGYETLLATMGGDVRRARQARERLAEFEQGDGR